MAGPGDARQQIGLDYLVKAGKIRAPEDAPPDLDEDERTVAMPEAAATNVEAFAKRAVLLALDEEEKTRGKQVGVRLSEVAEDVQLDAETLVPLARRLESDGLIEIVELTTFGDHRVRLTKDARRLLHRTSSMDLLRHLGIGESG